MSPDSVRVHHGAEQPQVVSEKITRHYSNPIEVPGIESNPRWSILTSEAVFNLRAALDYLVYSLSTLDRGRPPQRRTQFPIASSEPDFKDAIRRGNLDGLSSVHRRVIESLQPYRGGRWLEELAAISNPDKHRELVATIPNTDLALAVLHDGVDASGDRVVGMNLQMARYISFADRTPVIPRLQALKGQVVETIALFSSEFPEHLAVKPAPVFYRLAVTRTRGGGGGLRINF